jgi:MFS family permease
VLPAVVDAWGLTGLRAGLLFGAFKTGSLVAAVPLGMLTNRYLSRVVIAAGATAAATASIAFAALADGFFAGGLLRFVTSLGMAGVYVPGIRFVSEWFDAATRGRAMGVYVGTFSLGSGLSFVLTSGVATGSAGVRAWSSRARSRCSRPPRCTCSAGTHRSGHSAVGDSTSPCCGTGRSSRASACTAHTTGNCTVSGTGCRRSSSQRCNRSAATPAATAGLLAGVVTAAGGIGNLSDGWLSDRLGRRRVIGFGLVLSGAGAGLLNARS